MAEGRRPGGRCTSCWRIRSNIVDQSQGENALDVGIAEFADIRSAIDTISMI